MEPRLRLALQKSGRLAEGSLSLLRKCGFDLKGNTQRLLIRDNVFGIDFIFTRDDDILGLVKSGRCDIGIIGQNVLEESLGQVIDEQSGVEIVMPLGFAQCRLSIAVPEGEEYESIKEMEGKVIATSYPNTLSAFLEEHNIDARIVTLHGSIELAPKIGMADLICDLVSTGSTLRANALQELMQIRMSEAVLVRNGEAFEEKKQILLDKLLLRINGVLNASQRKYIMLHIDRSRLNRLREVLPGSESPTVLELEDIPGKVAVHMVSLEQVFWDTIEKLKDIGASSILVMPIEKMVP